MRPMKTQKMPRFWLGISFLIAVLFIPNLHARDLRISDKTPSELLESSEEEQQEKPKPEIPTTPFHFDMNRWNETREAIEEGREPGEKLEEDVVVSTQPVTGETAAPLLEKVYW